MKFTDREEIFTSASSHKRGLAGILNKILKSKDEPALIEDDDNEEAVAAEPLEHYFGKNAKNDIEREPEKPKFDFSAITKNRLYLGIACVVFAFLIGFVFVPMSSHLASIKTVTVLRAAADIPMGAQITPDMLQQVEISAQNVPSTIVIDPLEAVGKYAAMQIVTDENILSTKLADEPPYGNAYLSELPNGDLAVSVTIKSFAAGVSGKLLPGDVVSVYANLANNPNQYDYRSSLMSELYYVEVLAVSNEEIGDVQDYEGDPEEDDVSTLPTTVTLRCINLEQARVLIGLEANSQLHLALVCRGDEEYKKQLLDAQAQYFILLALQQEQMMNNTSSYTESIPEDSSSSESTSSESTSSNTTSSKGAGR